jgi:hypothetical protein
MPAHVLELISHALQHAFENLEESAKDGIIDELLNQGPTVFGEITKNQWGSYCIQHSQCFYYCYLRDFLQLLL